MTRLTITLVAVLTTACVARAGFGVSAPPPRPAVVRISGGALPPDGPPEGAPVAAPPASRPLAPPAKPAASPGGGNYGPGEDAHWFQSDDYLVADKKYQNEKMNVSVAKMIGGASGNTKGEGHFLYATGEQKWTAGFYRTRIAARADLRVGAIAFCYAPWWGGEPPKDKEAARNHGWSMAAITDVADLYKGRVTVGGASCAIGAVRVLAE
jgi:hypothetical protein